MKVGGTTITDNGPLDVNPLVGQITNIAAPPAFVLTINSGTTTPSPSIDISSVDITSSAPATLVVSFTETDLTAVNPASWLTQFTGSWTGGAASVELQTYVDTSNTAFGT